MRTLRLVIARRAHGNGDDRKLHRVQLDQDRLRFGQGRRQDHAFDVAVGEAADDFSLLVGIFRFAGFDHQVRACVARRMKRADEELREIGGAGIGVEQTDVRRFARGKAARGRVGRIIELCRSPRAPRRGSIRARCGPG